MNMEKPLVIVNERTREELLTVQEFANRTRLHPRSIYRLIKQKKQRGVVRIGGHIRINAHVALSPE